MLARALLVALEPRVRVDEHAQTSGPRRPEAADRGRTDAPGVAPGGKPGRRLARSRCCKDTEHHTFPHGSGRRVQEATRQAPAAGPQSVVGSSRSQYRRCRSASVAVAIAVAVATSEAARLVPAESGRAAHRYLRGPRATVPPIATPLSATDDSSRAWLRQVRRN